MVMSPVGARCPECAKIMKSPIYTLTTGRFLRAAGASLVGGVVMGLIWGAVLVPFTVGFFSIFLGAFLGWIFTWLLDFATGKKRGPIVVGCAVGGMLVAWGMQFLFVRPEIALYGLVAVAVGTYFAYQRLSRV